MFLDISAATIWRQWFVHAIRMGLANGVAVNMPHDMSQYYCKRKFIYSVKGLDCPHDQWGLTEPFHKNIVFPWRFTEGSDGDREKCQYPTPSLIPTLWIKSMCNCFPFFKFLTINEYKHATWTCYYINVVIMPVDPPTTARIHCNFKLRFRILEAFRSCIFFGITL